MDLQFIASGVPVPQGSHRAFNRGGRVVVTHTNSAKLTEWRDTVREAAVRAASEQGWEVADYPIGVSLAFRMPKPAKPKHDVPAVRPDLDKLTRAVFDALTDGKEPGVIKDDSLIVNMMASEEYNRHPGVTVTIYPIGYDDDSER